MLARMEPCMESCTLAKSVFEETKPFRLNFQKSEFDKTGEKSIRFSRTGVKIQKSNSQSIFQ